MNDLVKVEDQTVLAAYSAEDGLKAVIAQTKKAVEGFDHDMETGVSRAKTASLSAKVSKLKTKLDNLGKELVSEWKTKSKAVDKNRKIMRDGLDEIRDVARKPLNDWEAEQKRIEEQKQAEEEAKILAEKIENDHEMAVLLDQQFDREAAEHQAELDRIQKVKLAEYERAKVVYEANIAKEAAAKAERETLEAVAREQTAKDAQAKAEQDAKEASIRAEEQAKAATEQARLNAIEAERIAKEQVEDAALQAKKDQIAAQKAEELRVKAEQEKRESNKRHIGSIRKQAKESIMSLGHNEAEAKKLVMAITNGQIKNVSINY